MKKVFGLLFAIALAACGGSGPDMSPQPPVEPDLIRMNFSRWGHTATPLNDGRVLIVGGIDGNGDNVATPEVYVPSDNAFAGLGGVVIDVGPHTATLLNDNTVLIVGGAAAYLFDPVANSVSTTGPPNLPRTGHTATLLEDGNVLIVGGDSVPENRAEIYDVLTGEFRFTAGSTILARSGHTASRLPDGSVLILGVHDVFTPEGEVYDPDTDLFLASANPQQLLADHAVSLLPDNTLLITGSRRPDTGAFVNSPQIYDPATNLFTFTGNNMAGVRANHTATALPGGNVLVAGGENASGSLATAEIYRFAGGTFEPAAGSMAVARSLHTATRLPNGKVLIAGGRNADGVSGSAEIFDPATETFSADYD